MSTYRYFSKKFVINYLIGNSLDCLAFDSTNDFLSFLTGQ